MRRSDATVTPRTHHRTRLANPPGPAARLFQAVQRYTDVRHVAAEQLLGPKPSQSSTKTWLFQLKVRLRFAKQAPVTHPPWFQPAVSPVPFRGQLT
jgi:hypothetical protein